MLGEAQSQPEPAGERGDVERILAADVGDLGKLGHHDLGVETATRTEKAVVGEVTDTKDVERIGERTRRGGLLIGLVHHRNDTIAECAEPLRPGRGGHRHEAVHLRHRPGHDRDVEPSLELLGLSTEHVEAVDDVGPGQLTHTVEELAKPEGQRELIACDLVDERQVVRRLALFGAIAHGERDHSDDDGKGQEEGDLATPASAALHGQR